jgi:hypothetical protein
LKNSRHFQVVLIGSQQPSINLFRLHVATYPISKEETLDFREGKEKQRVGIFYVVSVSSYFQLARNYIIKKKEKRVTGPVVVVLNKRDGNPCVG